MALGAERQRALQALGARLAHPHGLDGARVGGGDRPAGRWCPRRRRAGCRRRAARQRSRARSTQASGSTNVARSASRPSSGEQLADEVGRHAHVLGEAAGVQRRGAEPLAQRLVAAPAAPALAARRVVVDDDAVARRDAVDARRRPRSTSAASSWPRTAGTLRATQASRTSEPQTPHASTRQTTSPAPALGVGRLLDAHLARRRRERATLIASSARDRTRRRAARATPRSVTSAVTSSAGVTSKAGLRTGVPGERRAATPPNARTSSRVALLDLDAVAVGQRGSIDDVGPATTNGMPAARAASARRVGADLVGDVAVGGDAVAADDHGVDLAAADQPGRGAVDDQLVRARRRARAPTPSAARPAAAAASRRRARRRRAALRAARGSPPSAVPRPPAASAPVLQCVSDRAARRPAGRRRGAAIAARGGVLLGVDALGLGARGARPSSAGPAASAAARTRSTAQARLTAVGRARAQQLPAALERAEAGPARDLHRQPVRGGDRRSAARRARRGAGSPAAVSARARRAPATPRARAARVWSRTARRAPVPAQGRVGLRRDGHGGSVLARRQRQSKCSRWMRLAGTPAARSCVLEAAQHRPADRT